MLAARDQENLIHTQQTVAAGKPLNQGAKHIPPKTPRPKTSKTPAKIRLNDENALNTLGGFRGNGTVAKAKIVQNAGAFVTPLQPRNRAPLGLKTTNAKTKNFKTPDVHNARLQGQKSGSKNPEISFQKEKLKSSTLETVEVDILGAHRLNEEQDVEYMAPREKVDAEYPEEYPPDLDFDLLGPANQLKTRLAYHNTAVDHDGLTRPERAEQARQQQNERVAKDIDSLMEREIQKMKFTDADEPDTCTTVRPAKATSAAALSVIKKSRAATRPLKSRQEPSFEATESAAAALSVPQPKNSMNSKSLITNSRKTGAASSSARSNSQGQMASRSTLGYSHGRIASGSIARPVDWQGNAVSNTESVLKKRERIPITISPSSGQNLQAPQEAQVAEAEDIDERFSVQTLSQLLKEDETDDDFQLAWSLE